MITESSYNDKNGQENHEKVQKLFTFGSNKYNPLQARPDNTNPVSPTPIRITPRNSIQDSLYTPVCTG